ncbi:actin organization and endocytosis protein [Coemansia sp. BCRC 34301]|nr:actin organization and endocytosis protein [Coemansia sp. BCRC 34301]
MNLQQDQQTYAATFHSNVAAGSTRISGDAARRVLMQSQLPVSDLGRIWELSDTRSAGSLSLAEFKLALFLTQSRIRGKALPDRLPPKIAAEVAAVTMPTPTAVTQQHLSNVLPMPTPAVITQQHLPNVLPMPTPLHFATPSGGEPESILDFESQFPDIVPSSSTAMAGGGTALSVVRESFISQGVLGSRVGESQHQWAITPTEKAQYEAIFRRWDPGRRGVLKGEQAREVFAQSGLTQHELAKIWTLSDINNQGELNLDEFSVAMHLIFRRLAGAAVPDSLPMELVPRSSKDFMDSLLDMKEQLMFKRPSTTATTTASASRTQSVLPAQQRSGGGGEVADFGADDDGDAHIYQSAHRRRNNNNTGGGSSSPSVTDHRSQSPSLTATAESVDQLRRLVQQRRDEVRQAKADAERRQKERAESRVTGRWRVDDLKREIEDIHRATPVNDSDDSDDDSDRGRLLAKRKRLVTSIGDLVQIMPALVRDYERIAGDLADASKDVARRREANGRPPPASDMEARAARLVAQRMAALTGQPLEEPDTGGAAEEIAAADRKLKERRDRVQSIASSLEHVTRAMRELKTTAVGDARKWEDGVGVVSEEVRDFVARLRHIERLKSPPSAKTEPAGASLESPPVRTSAFSPVIASPPPVSETRKPDAPTIAERLALATSKQERDRILQDIAEERFRERQRALGIPDPAPAEVPAPALAPAPAKRPEMQERTSVASNPFAVDNPSEATTAPRTVAAPLEAKTFGDDSSEDEDDEWDRDDSSSDDDNGLPLEPDQFGPPVARSNIVVDSMSRLRAESPASSVSFDTAFANPAGVREDDDVNAAMSVVVAAAAKDESNPFLGLLAASSASGGSEFEKLRLRALYPYHVADGADDELAIETGDLIETRAVPSDKQSAAGSRGAGWLYGEILQESATDEGDGWQPSGRAGWFPKDYAETLGGPGSRGWNKTRALFGTAKYDYEPQHEDELRVCIGDRVRVVDGDAAESWWKVRKLGGTGASSTLLGMLPAMYIDVDKQ